MFDYLHYTMSSWLKEPFVLLEARPVRLSAYRYEAAIHVKVQGKSGWQIRELGRAQWIDLQEQGLSRESLLEMVQRNLSISSVVAVSNISHSKALTRQQRSWDK